MLVDVTTFLLISAPKMERTCNFDGRAAKKQLKYFFGVASHFTVILWRLFHENMILDSIASNMETKYLLWTLYLLNLYPSNFIQPIRCMLIAHIYKIDV